MTALTAEVLVNVLIEGQSEAHKLTVGGMMGTACPFTTFGELMYALTSDQRFVECDPQSIQIYDGFLQRFVPIDPKETIPDQVKIKLNLKKAHSVTDFIAPPSNNNNSNNNNNANTNTNGGLLSTTTPISPAYVVSYAATRSTPSESPHPHSHQPQQQQHHHATTQMSGQANQANGGIRNAAATAATPAPAGFHDLLNNFLCMSSSERNVFMKLASEAGFPPTPLPNPLTQVSCRSSALLYGGIQGLNQGLNRPAPVVTGAVAGPSNASCSDNLVWHHPISTPLTSPIHHNNNSHDPSKLTQIDDHDCEVNMNRVSGGRGLNSVAGCRDQLAAGGDGAGLLVHAHQIIPTPAANNHMLTMNCNRHEIRSEAAQIPTQIRKILRKKPPFFAERAAQMLLLSDRIGRQIIAVVNVFEVARDEILASNPMNDDQLWSFIASKMKQQQHQDPTAALHSNLQAALFKIYLGHFCLIAQNSDHLVEANVLWPFFSLIHQAIIHEIILEKTVPKRDAIERILTAKSLIESRHRSKFGCVNQFPEQVLKCVALSPDAQFRAAVYNFWSESLMVRERNLRLLEFLAKHREHLARAHSRGHEIWKRVTNELNNYEVHASSSSSSLEVATSNAGDCTTVVNSSPSVVVTRSGFPLPVLGASLGVPGASPSSSAATGGKYFNYFRTTQATFEKLISFYNSMCQNVNSLDEAEMIWPRGFRIINLSLIDCSLLLKLGVNPTLADKAIRVHEAARNKFTTI